MDKNPYEFLRPVVGRTFVGRHTIIDEICQDLSYSSGASYAIIGGRRFGKSSLLLSIQERIRSRPEYSNILSVFVDMNQGFSSPEIFFGYVIREITSQGLMRVQNPNHWRQILGAFHDEIPYDKFVDTLQVVLEKLPQQNKIVLLIDEIDVAIKSQWHEIFFDQLRTLFYSSSVRDSINLILAGANFYYHPSLHGSPLINAVKVQYLECLQESAIDQLAEIARRIPKEITKEVWRYSGGHPHLAQFIFYSLWKESPNFANTNVNSVSRAVAQYYKHYSQNLDNWIASVGINGWKVYDILTKKEAWCDEKDIAKWAKLSMNLTNQALVKLCFQGVVGLNIESGRYRAQGELFKNWFLQNKAELMAGQKDVSTKNETNHGNEYHIQHLEVVQNKIETNEIKGNVSQRIGLTTSEVEKLFKPIHARIEHRPKTTAVKKKAISKTVKEIEKELTTAEPRIKFFQTRFENLKKMAPDILEVVLATVISPASGFTSVAKKIAEKIKKETNTKNQ